MRTRITILLLLFISLPIFSQTKGKKECYQLGNYEICPDRKMVKSKNFTTTSFYDAAGNYQGHGHGHEYVGDPRIDYDNTILYFIGNQVIFKEYLRPEINMNSLKVFDSSFGEYNDVLCVDNKRVYDNIFRPDDEDEDDEEKDRRISGKKYVGNRIYKGKKGQLYVFNNDDYPLLDRIAKDSPLDLPTLKYVYNSFFYDKNGLYHLKADYSYDADYNSYLHPRLLEKSDGQSIISIVEEEYIVYGTSVYQKSNFIKKWDLSSDKIRFFDVYYGKRLITDGSNSYYYEEKITRKEFEQTKNWQQIGAYGSFTLILDDKDSTIYFASEKKSYNNQKQSRLCLIHDTDRYLLIDTKNGVHARGWETYEYKEVQIFNYHMKAYESLDVSQFRYIGDELYVYKGILYSNDCSPVVERDKIDVENLKPYYYNGKKTEYYTDGKVLLYNGNRTGYTSTEDEYPEIYFESRIVENVDIETLKAISKDILLDKNNIYNGYYRGIETIPIKKLGLKIVMYTED